MSIYSSTMLVLSAIFLIDLIGILVAGEPTAVVKTTSGPVQGEILKTGPNSVAYAAFKGIRYAKAPIGYLRFKPPVPVDPWTTTLNATTEGSVCPQVNPLALGIMGSEDCLFLNVLTPVTDLSVTPTALKSVMVWIHGGAFVIGSGSTQLQRPDYLLEKNVIFVSMNYRLGALGFLNLNHANATGNAGLKDQNLALKWVQSNIAKFGGNPKNVTIFGGSAGGASVGYHIISGASAGLFHGAISMSGVPLAPWAFQTGLKALSTAQQLAKYLGTFSTDKETLLNAYYKATPAQLVIGVIPIGLLITFPPTAENASIATEPFLTESPYRKFYTGKYNKVREMIGFMEQEILSFAIGLPVFLEVINVGLEQVQKIGVEPPKSLTTIRDLIISGGNLKQIDERSVQAAINITSAIHFVSPIDRTQRFLAANNDGKPVYYYHISFYPKKSPHIFPGAGHGDDGAYIFYIPLGNNSTDPNDPVTRTISRMTTMWTNFAKYGNPTPNWIDNSAVGVHWPDSGRCGKALDIGYKLTVGPRPINEDTELIEILSWPDEKKSLGNPGFIRPIWQV